MSSTFDPRVEILKGYATGPNEHHWIQTELAKAPLLPNQTAEEWLQWRAKVGEGLDEAEAWDRVVRERPPASLMDWELPTDGGGGLDPGYWFQQDPSLLQPHAYDYAPLQQQNGLVMHQSPAGDIQNAFVSMQDILPLPTAPFQYDDLPGPSRSASASPLPPDTSVSAQAETQLAASVADNSSSSSTSPFEDLDMLNGSLARSEATGHLAVVPPLGRKRRLLPTGQRSIPQSNRIRFDSSSIDRPPAEEMRRSTESTISSDVQRPPMPPPKPPPPIITMAATIRPVLLPEALKVGKPVSLFKHLRNKVIGGEITPPDFVPNPDELREILVALRGYAPDDYLKSMADNEKYVTVIGRWLRTFLKDPDTWAPAIAPLLLLLARTDMAVNYITDFKIGKLAKQVSDKVAASNLANKEGILNAFDRYQRWCKEKLFPAKRTIAPKEQAEDQGSSSTKKRKLDDDPPSKVADRVRSEKPTAPVAVVKPRSNIVPVPSTKPPMRRDQPTKTDMSFFGTPAASSNSAVKPRPKLPEFKKRDPAGLPPMPAAAPAPAARNSLLSSIMSSASAALPPPAQTFPAGPAASPPPTEQKTKLNKKGHAVRFKDLVPDGGALEEIRLFKEEPHELEPAPWRSEDGTHGLSAHQLDVDEGKALRSHEAEHEPIEWYPPDPLDLSALPDLLPVPLRTSEVEAQEQRERGILAVNYAPGQLPASANEDGVRIIDTGPSTRIFDAPPIAGFVPSTTAVPAPSVNLNELLGRIDTSALANIQLQQSQSQPQSQPGYNYQQQQQPQPQPYGQYAGYNGYPSGSADQYAAWSQGNSSGQQYGAQAPWSGQDGYGHDAGYGDRGFDRPSDDGWVRSGAGAGAAGNRGRGKNGRGGRREDADDGRSKPFKARVCKFWEEGKCRLGDRCTFKHSYD